MPKFIYQIQMNTVANFKNVSLTCRDATVSKSDLNIIQSYKPAVPEVSADTDEYNLKKE